MTTDRVLLLNSSYEPVSLISQERAIVLWYSGKVTVVAERDITWRSVSIVIKVPSIVRLVNYVRGLSGRRNIVKMTRKNIMLRDNYTCQYCGVHASPEKLNIDHVVPKGQGGKSEWTNLVTTCIRCNSDKDCRTPKQAGMTLRKVPKKPDFIVFTLHRNVKNVPEDWRSYLYWNTEIDQN
jgi:5-methylcytosine-specific restriction endonuclease McrA